MKRTALLFAALCCFGAGFTACWFTIRIEARETMDDLTRMVFLIQNERDLMVAEDLYLSEPPGVGLGAMLSYVHKRSAELQGPAIEAYPEWKERIYSDLYLTHARVAKLYRQLNQEDAAERHTRLALAFVSHKGWIDEEDMKAYVESRDKEGLEQRQSEATNRIYTAPSLKSVAGEIPGAMSEPPICETNSFTLSRASFLVLSKSILDSPARRQKLAESFLPVQDSSDRVIGYRVVIQGEADLFSRMGLHAEDIVLSINGMAITTKSRLAHFSKYFIQHQMNAFVADLDRKGKLIRHIYWFE